MLTDRRVVGFSPLVQKDSRILVLGTMPGVKSLDEQQYYAHPRNAFWYVIATLTRQPFTTDYEERKCLLQIGQIALWDVCDQCIREGSLDSKITDEQPNDIGGLLQQHPRIRTVCFNGQGAYKLFKRYFCFEDEITYHILPSTSPTYASLTIDQKCREWERILSPLLAR